MGVWLASVSVGCCDWEFFFQWDVVTGGLSVFQWGVVIVGWSFQRDVVIGGWFASVSVG